MAHLRQPQQAPLPSLVASEPRKKGRRRGLIASAALVAVLILVAAWPLGGYDKLWPRPSQDADSPVAESVVHEGASLEVEQPLAKLKQDIERLEAEFAQRSSSRDRAAGHAGVMPPAGAGSRL